MRWGSIMYFDYQTVNFIPGIRKFIFWGLSKIMWVIFTLGQVECSWMRLSRVMRTTLFGNIIWIIMGKRMDFLSEIFCLLHLERAWKHVWRTNACYGGKEVTWSFSTNLQKSHDTDTFTDCVLTTPALQKSLQLWSQYFLLVNCFWTWTLPWRGRCPQWHSTEENCIAR